MSVATEPPGVKTVYTGGGRYLAGGGRETNKVPPTLTFGFGGLGLLGGGLTAAAGDDLDLGLTFILWFLAASVIGAALSNEGVQSVVHTVKYVYITERVLHMGAWGRPTNQQWTLSLK